MRISPIAVLAAASALLGGCSTSADCDPDVEDCGLGDTAAGYDGAVALLQFDHGCCGPGEDRCPGLGAWWVDVVTDGAPAGVSVSLQETRPPVAQRWREEHAVPVVFSDADGYWTDHYLELEVSRTTECNTLKDCAERFTSGENTLFACSDDLQADGIQLRVELIGKDGSVLDCAQDGATTALDGDCQ